MNFTRENRLSIIYHIDNCLIWIGMKTENYFINKIIYNKTGIQSSFVGLIIKSY
jgi:hypothetical protein